MAEPSAFTPRDLANRWRIDIDSVYGLIRSRKLLAFDISPPGSKRPSWRISADAVRDFERGQQSAETVKPRRRSRRTAAAGEISYY